mgnify:FL=1
MNQATATYCANHPNRETSLRCNRCGKLICSKCAVRTPTGYRCEECVKGQQKTFVTAQLQDYPLAFLVGGVLSYLGGLLAGALSFFVLFLAPIAGGLIAEAIRRVVSKRRAPNLFKVAAAGVALGAAPFLLRPLLFLLAGAGMGALFALLWPLVYLLLVTYSTYASLSGMRLGR